jgi:hypothetical protein
MTVWSSLTWTTARAGGITAYVLLSLAVVLGLALSMRWQHPRWPRLITNELHNYLMLLSFVFIGVHSLAVLLDPFTTFTLQDVLVPLASTYRTIWLSLGIVASYLAIAIWISTWLRPHIGYAIWRKMHVLTFLVYLASTLHGIGTGSDTRTVWGLALYGGSTLLVGTLLVIRLLRATKTAPEGHPMLAGATVFTLLIGALWTLNGPLKPGWAAANNGGIGTATVAQHTTTTTTTGVGATSPAQPTPVPSQQQPVPAATAPGYGQDGGGWYGDGGYDHHHDDGGFQGGDDGQGYGEYN